MRIIILGSTGYLGSKLVHKLLENNHELLCIIRKESNLRNLENVLDDITLCTINDLESILCKKEYDCIINLACKYSRDHVDEDVFEANFYNPLTLMIKCIRHNIDKIITIDTGLINDLNAYSFSKSILSETLRWYCRQNVNLSVLNIKLENYYGKDEPTNRFIPQTIIKLKNNEKIPLTDGKQIRDFIYVQDVVDNLYNLIISDCDFGFHNVPLGTGNGVSIKELITYLKEITGSESELCFGAIEKRKGEPDSVADRNIMNKYNINIKYDWKQGMKLLVGE